MWEIILGQKEAQKCRNIFMTPSDLKAHGPDLRKAGPFSFAELRIKGYTCCTSLHPRQRGRSAPHLHFPSEARTEYRSPLAVYRTQQVNGLFCKKENKPDGQIMWGITKEYGEVSDYAHKGRVICTNILLPPQAPLNAKTVPPSETTWKRSSEVKITARI